MQAMQDRVKHLKHWKWTVGVLLVLALLFTGRRTESRTSLCRVCGASKELRTTYFVRIPVWWSRSGPKATDLSELYRRCIAQRHEHEWYLAAHSSTQRSLLHGSFHSDGVRSHGPYPRWQPQLIWASLEAISRAGIDDPEERARVYSRMIDAKTEEEFAQLLTLAKKGGRIRLPEWAYSDETAP